jgi:serine/threonine protein kinase
MNELIYIDEKFPSYQIIEMLSENPTSRVFLAERGDKLFVLKEQPKEFCFLKNPAVLRGLDCPGLPKIVDFYETDESFFWSYEYINGVTLTEAYESGLITTGAAVAVTEKLCGIVSYLHGKSLLHCDIKPDNILINGDKVFLIDFGIAHIYNKNSGGETAIIGTEGFVTPELGYRKTDFRADVYAIGMVLFYLLTGSADIKELPEKVSDRPLRAIISRAANYEVGKRYKTVGKLQNALRKYEKGTAYRPFFAVLLSACFVFCFIAGGLIFPAVSEGVNAYFGTEKPQIYEFSDPVVEKAIRLSLGKTADEAVYPYELLNVYEIYIAGDQAFGTDEERNTYVRSFYDAQKSPPFAELKSVDDLAACKNLRSLNIEYTSLDNIDVLGENHQITSINLGYTHIGDISIITKFPMLTSIGLDSCPISDLSPIAACPQIEFIELSHVNADNYKFFVPGKQYSYVSLSFVYFGKFMPDLSGLTVNELKVEDCGITEFDVFPDMTITETLNVKGNDLKNTDGAERILADGAEIIR